MFRTSQKTIFRFSININHIKIHIFIHVDSAPVKGRKDLKTQKTLTKIIYICLVPKA